MAAILPEEFRTLFLGDLSIHCTRQDVLNMFHPFGYIERITLKVGTSMKGLGYGFITFSERESAENAMFTMNGAILLGRAIRICWATPRGQTSSLIPIKGIPKVQSQTAEVHFSFISKQTHFIITEAIIRKHYEQFGEIVDIVIKRTKLNQNGYGFVRYALNSEGIQAAISATQTMHQVMVDGINFDTHLTHALEELLERINPELLREIQRRESSPAVENEFSEFHKQSAHEMMMEDGENMASRFPTSRSSHQSMGMPMQPEPQIPMFQQNQPRNFRQPNQLHFAQNPPPLTTYQSQNPYQGFQNNVRPPQFYQTQDPIITPTSSQSYSSGSNLF